MERIALGKPGKIGAAHPAPGLRGTQAQGTRTGVFSSHPLWPPEWDVVPGKVTAMKRAFVPALVLSALAGIALPATPATAQMVCGKRTDMVRQLDEKYGETRRSLGLAEGRGVVELFASEETGSWTILLTSPQGTACMMAAGEAFQIEQVMAEGNPA